MGMNTTKSDSVTRVLVRKEKLNFRKINGDHLTTEHENVKNVPNESTKKSVTLFKFNSIHYIYLFNSMYYTTKPRTTIIKRLCLGLTPASYVYYIIFIFPLGGTRFPCRTE